MSSITFHVNTMSPLLVQAGDTVNFDTPLTKKTTSSQERISISHHLKIPPQQIFMHMQKVVGEQVKKHEVIAQKKSMFGMKRYMSQAEGIIREINHNEGTIVIESYAESAEITYSHFKGMIENIEQGLVTLRVNQSMELALKEATIDFGGPVLVVDERIPLNSLNYDDVAGRVIVAKAVSPVDAVRLDVLDEAGTVTLHEFNQNTPFNCARIKNVTDWEMISHSKLPYCIIDKTRSTMYLYE